MSDILRPEIRSVSCLCKSEYLCKKVYTIVLSSLKIALPSTCGVAVWKLYQCGHLYACVQREESIFRFVHKLAKSDC